MFRKIITALILISFTLLQGCTATRSVPVDEYQSKIKLKKDTVSSVVTTDGKRIKYDLLAGGGKFQQDTIVGPLNDGSTARVPLSQVKAVYVQELQTVNTIALVGVTALFIALAVAIGSSHAIILPT